MTDGSNKRWPWLGLAYGCVLLAFGAGNAGAGHGTYLPFGIYGAPLSIVPIVGMFIAPAWWGIVGKMLALRQREVSVTMMSLHTIAVGLVLAFGTPMESGDDRWKYFGEAERIMPVGLWSGIVFYVVGLLVAWRATISLWRSQAERS